MASLTPDPKKRSFLLPLGCKDLIDVLKPPSEQGKAAVHALLKRVEADRIENEFSTLEGPLSEVERFVTMLSVSTGLSPTLSISLPDEDLSVNMRHAQNKGLSAYVYIQMGTEREKAVRMFFAQHHLQMPADAPMPTQFVPGLPVHQCYNIFPLAADAHGTSLLITDFFRQVAGLDENSTLSFQHHGTTNHG